MFPGQQGATWPSQLWPPRLGIKLLEGAPSTEKCAEGAYFRITSQKIGGISLVFAQWVERAQSGHINPATPVLYLLPLLPPVERARVAPGARAETARAGRPRAGDHKSILPQIFVFTPEAQAPAGQT